MSDFEKILEKEKPSKRKCVYFEEKEYKCKVQLTLDRYGSGKELLTQKHFDNLLLKFFIDETQPLSLVDKPAFINLIRLGLPREISVMCKQTLHKKISDLYSKMIDNTIQKLSAVCTLQQQPIAGHMGNEPRSYLPLDKCKESAKRISIISM